LNPEKVKAAKQTLELLEDHSVLAKGVFPNHDEYTVEIVSARDALSGIRLEALQHASLPGGGLSRVKSGNFVLTDFAITIQRKGGKPEPVKFAKAKATYNQSGLDVAQAIDNKPDSGWGVWPGKQVTQAQTAVFTLAKPLVKVEGARLVFRLKFNHAAKQHVMGRLRLSATDMKDPDFGTGGLLQALNTELSKRTKAMREIVAREMLKEDTASAKLESARAAAQKRIGAIRKGFPKVMVMGEGKPRQTKVLTRGAYNNPTDVVVSSNTPESLSPFPKSSPKNRLGLAAWLVDGQHPLTARVTVNRIWQQFFGTGFVKTTENFGVQSERPSHPALLDWLALEFIKSGWDVKALHRRIVLSATYRQSSRITPALHERDPENRLLTRMTRQRLPSWMIRDQALFVSGLLVEKQGGPPVKPYQPGGVWAEATFGKKRYSQDKGEALYRRSLYTFWRRIVGPTMFFDESKRQTCEVRRALTNTPLHALVTLNDIAYVEAARAMAQRVLKEGGADDGVRVSHAFRLATSREPKLSEHAILLQRLNQLRATYAKDPKATQALLAVGEFKRDEKLNATAHAAYSVLCNLILNLDEVITRE
jgi:hypothetical protein